MSIAKETNITKFKESKKYKSDLTNTANLVLAKERIKTKRFLWKLYQIEDMSLFEKITKEPTFFDVRDDEKEEEGEGLLKMIPQKVHLRHKC